MLLIERQAEPFVPAQPRRREEVRRRKDFVPRDLLVRPLEIEEIPRLNGLDRSETFAGRFFFDEFRTAGRVTLPYTYPPEPIPTPDWSHPELLMRFDLWREVYSGRGVMLGGVHRGRVVGVALLSPVLLEATAELCLVFVEATMRRLGIGSRLVAGIEDRARDAGADRIGLFCDFNASAMAFHIRHGFRISSVKRPPPVQRRVRPNDVRMARALR